MVLLLTLHCVYGVFMKCVFLCLWCVHDYVLHFPSIPFFRCADQHCDYYSICFFSFVFIVVFTKLCLWCVYCKSMLTLRLCVNALLRNFNHVSYRCTRVSLRLSLSSCNKLECMNMCIYIYIFIHTHTWEVCIGLLPQ